MNFPPPASKNSIFLGLASSIFVIILLAILLSILPSVFAAQSTLMALQGKWRTGKWLGVESRLAMVNYL